MKLNYNVTISDVPQRRKAKRTKVEETLSLLKKFVRSDKDVCGVSYSGGVETAYQYLLKARREGGIPVKIIKRGKTLFLQREVS